jgi:hypothetical protein
LTNDKVDIPIDLTGLDPKTVDVAIWWPEKLLIRDGVRQNTHNDIDLYLYDPSDDEEASGINADGVFERIQATVKKSDLKKWTVRVHGFNVRSGPQDVYVAVLAQRSSDDSSPLKPSPIPSSSP